MTSTPSQPGPRRATAGSSGAPIPPSFCSKRRAVARSLLAAAALSGCGGNVEWSSGAAGAAGSSGGSSSSGTGGAPGGSACKPGDAPVMLATGKPGTVALALDSDHVYFWLGTTLDCTTAGEIGRVPKSGGPAEVLWTTYEEVAALATDGKHVYFTDDVANKCTQPPDPGYMLYAAPSGGGLPKPLPAAQPSSAATAMTLDSGHVYWAAGVQPIFATALDGSTSDIFMTPGYPPSDVAADETRVYILGSSGLHATVKSPKGNPMPLFEIGSAALRGLAMDADHLYFGGWGTCEGKECVYETETLRALAKDGGSMPVTIASRPDRRTVRMAVDATHVYWTERSSPQAAAGGAVMRVPKQGGAYEEIASAQEPSDIAVDESCIYWAEQTSGGVWKAPKPQSPKPQ